MNAPAKPATKSNRLTKQGWLDIGMVAMSETGPDGLTIDAICARAGKTRGSFYHHFKSTDIYLNELVLWWKKCFTLDVIEKTEKHTKPSGKHDNLNQLAAHLDPKAEQAFRQLAARDKHAAQIVREVDDIRIAYLTRLYQHSSLYDDAQAAIIAKTEYAAWVGFQLIEPDASPAQMLEMYQGFLALTGRA